MGFFILLGVLIYIVAAILISRLAWKTAKRSSTKYLVIAFLIIFPTWDSILGLPYYHYLCENQSGQRILKTVDNVEGFLWENKDDECSGCEEILLKNREYKFIEVATVIKSEPVKKVYYRFYRGNRGSVHCSNYYSKLEKYTPGHLINYFEDYPEEYCLAKEKVNEIKSQYSYRSFTLDHDFLPIFHISKGVTTIRDIKTGEVIGEAVSFVHYGAWWKVMLLGKTGGFNQCPSVVRGEPDIHVTLKKVVLRPQYSKGGDL